MPPADFDDEFAPSPAEFWILVLVLLIGLGSVAIDFIHSYLP